MTSQLARLFNTSRIYVLDIKLRDFNNWPGIIQSDTSPARPSSNDRIQVWQPTIIDPEQVERWLYGIRKDAPAIVNIDELLALCYGKRDTSDEYTRITKLGRALPVLTISNTQDLVELPRGVLSQPDHVVRFRLKHPYEKRVANVLLGTEVTEPPKYSFWYAHSESDSDPIQYENVQTFLGLNKYKRRF